MSINRRHFLTRAVASVPAVLAGAELAELLAPRKTIFLPPRGGWWIGNPFIWHPGLRVRIRDTNGQRYPLSYADVGEVEPQMVTIKVSYVGMPRGIRVADAVLVGDSDSGITV